MNIDYLILIIYIQRLSTFIFSNNYFCQFIFYIPNQNKHKTKSRIIDILVEILKINLQKNK